jgi:hypothetical protein
MVEGKNFMKDFQKDSYFKKCFDGKKEDDNYLLTTFRKDS